MSAARRPRGFTLIEVLVALAIVVVGVAALLSTLSSAASTTAYLRDKTFAEWVGFNQIATVRLTMQPLPNGTSNGDLDYAGRKWHYEQDIEDLQLPGLRRIDVKVVLVPEGKSAAPKDTWTASVTGMLGASIASPNGLLPDWDDGAFPNRPVPPGAPGTPGAPGAPGSTPAAQPGGTGILFPTPGGSGIGTGTGTGTGTATGAGSP